MASLLCVLVLCGHKFCFLLRLQRQKKKASGHSDCLCVVFILSQSICASASEAGDLGGVVLISYRQPWVLGACAYIFQTNGLLNLPSFLSACAYREHCWKSAIT